MTEIPNRTIVTFFEEYGSGAERVAPRVAERLGVPYVTQRFSSDEIEAAETRDDPDDTLLGRIFAAFSPPIVADAAIAWSMDAMADDATVTENTASVHAAVKDGGVILGRSATQILAGVPGALHVKLIGPVEDRVARAAAEAGIDLDRARRRQQREDRVRVDMSKRFYRWDPSDDAPFDLVVNTGQFDLDQAVEVIVHAYRTRFGA